MDGGWNEERGGEWRRTDVFPVAAASAAGVARQVRGLAPCPLVRLTCRSPWQSVVNASRTSAERQQTAIPACRACPAFLSLSPAAPRAYREDPEPARLATCAEMC